MKRLLIVVALVLLVIPVTGQNLFKQFEFVTVEGRVMSRGGQPIVDCLVEIRTLSNQSTLSSPKSPADGPTGGAVPAGWGASDIGVVESGSYDISRLEKAGWGRTDAEGRYSISGISVPGSYILVVKGVDGFKNAQMALRVDKPRGETLKVHDLTLDPFVEIDGATKKLLKKADKALQANELEEAEDLLKQAAQNMPNLASVHVSLGNVYLKKKNAKGAYEAFQKAFELGEQNPELSALLARFAFQNQDFDLATVYVNGVLSAKPDDVQALYLGGVANYNLQNFEQAADMFGKYEAIRGDISKDVNLLYVYGMAEFTLKQYEKAAELLHTAYRNGWKADVPFMKTLANAYVMQNKNEEAKAILGELLEKFPQFDGREGVEDIYNKL